MELGGKVVWPSTLNGEGATEGEDRVKSLAAHLTKPENKQLSSAVVNRVWAWLFGRGIVHPVDDFTKRDPPMSAALLQRLTSGFVLNRSSLKKFVQELCRTEVYQLSDPKGASPEDAAYVRGWRRPWRMRKPPADMPKFTLPEPWSTYVGPDRRRWTLYRVPDKDRKAGDAFLAIAKSGWHEDIAAQMAPAKPKTETAEGKQAVTVTEVKGTYWCDLNSSAPLENHHVIFAQAGKPTGWHFCLEGPADTVADWRDEFVEILKGIE